MYRELDSQRILDTTRTLSQRVAERFPDSGLGRVAGELLATAEESEVRLQRLRRPHWPMRLGVGVAIAALVAIAVAAALTVQLTPGIGGMGEVLQTLEAGINDALFIGLAIFVLVSLEGRFKRVCRTCEAFGEVLRGVWADLRDGWLGGHERPMR